MTLCTVTVCPDCKYVFIVKKTPETTTSAAVEAATPSQN